MSEACRAITHKDEGMEVFGVAATPNGAGGQVQSLQRLRRNRCHEIGVFTAIHSK